MSTQEESIEVDAKTREAIRRSMKERAMNYSRQTDQDSVDGNERILKSDVSTPNNQSTNGGKTQIVPYILLACLLVTLMMLMILYVRDQTHTIDRLLQEVRRIQMGADQVFNEFKRV